MRRRTAAAMPEFHVTGNLGVLVEVKAS